jgi:gliding motility-associated-like protein
MSKTMRIPKYLLLFPLLALSSFGLLGQSLDVTTSKKNSCAGANNGSITITVDNTTTTVGPYSYLIFGIVNSNGPYTGSLTKGTPKTISNLPPDNYLVSVSDGDGSVANFSSFSLIVDTSPGISLSSTPTVVNNSNCSSPDGSITISPTGGSGSYTYSWTGPGSFTATTQNLSGLSGGNYVVVIGDNNANCSFTSSAIVVSDPLPNAFTISTPDNTLCNGDNLTINLQAPAPESGVTYTVEVDGTLTGSTFAGSSLSFAGLSVGSHTVRVKAALGSCTPIFNSAPNISVTVFSNVSVSTSQVNVTCNGGADGSITVTASGGSGAGYTYSKDNGTTFQAGNSFSGLTAGTYQIVVKDGNGCLSPASPVTITQPVTVTFTTAKVDVTGCFGNTNGSITVTASGGSGAGYTYSKDNGTTFQASNIFSSLGAGTYQIVVKDGNGCLSAASPVTITQPTALTLTNSGNIALNCFGDTNGSGTFTASGGTAPYTFSINSNTTGGTISSAATTATLSGAGVGSITVKVTDANGCTATSTITVTQPASALSLNNSGNIALNCFGDTNGSGTFTASGGTSPYTFTVNSNTTGGTTSTTATTLSLTGAGVGSITVKVTDANGCTATSTITVTQPASALVLTNTGNVALNCFGDTNGSGTFTASGGTSPYTFAVNSNTTGGTTSTTATTLSLTGAGVGSITVKVTDAKGCTTTSTINVTQPASALALTNTGNIALNCFGDTNGTGTFTAAGGTSPYTFAVNSNTTGGTTTTTATTLTLTGAGVGSITVKVTDANGCTTTSTITVTQPASALALNNSGNIALNCFGDTNGSGTFTASGGTSPYTFAINSNTTGGTTSSTATQVTLTGAGAGSITIQVTDAKGCTATSTITVTQPASALVLNNTGNIALNCFGDTNGTGTFTANGGTSPYTFTVNSNTTGGTTSTTATTLVLTGAGVGSITVKVTDAKGCTSTSTITVTQPASALVLNNSGNITLNCFGDTNGTGSFTASGGTSPYTFSVNSNTTGGTTSTTATQLNLTGAGAGSITVKVTDANGCTATSTITVTQPASALTLTNTGDIALNCFGDTNGAGSFTASGGTSPYTFVVNSNTTGATTSTTATKLSFTGAAIGSITVQVTDSKGCVTTSTINVTQPASALVLTNTGNIALNCFGDTNGTGTFTASGGTSPYTFAVNSNTTGGTTSTTATTLVLSGAGAGSITVKVTDAKGCTTTSTITITQPASALTLNNSGNIALNCFGDTNGTGSFTASGGTSPYTFTVNSNTTGGTTATTATTLTLTGAGVGSITVKVTDANGCTATSTITVTQPASALALTNTGNIALNCFGDTNGAGSFTASGGTAPFTFVVTSNTTGATTTTAATTLSFSGAGIGTIAIQVTDAKNCTTTSSIAVTQPASALVLTNTGDVALNCFGDTSGTGTFTASGGTAPYTFTVNSNTTGGTTTTNATQLDLTGAGVGSITVKVTDAKGCTTTSTINVTQPASPLLLNNTGNINLNCSGDTNGSGTFTASGGTSPYTFTINSNTTGGTTTSTATTLSLTGAGVGSITVKVTDANGCTSTSTITVSQPTVVTLTFTQVDVSCNGLSDGSITITASGGSGAGYTYSKDNGTTFQAGNVFTNLPAGGYQIVVKDGNGCLSSASSVTITQPAAISVSATQTDATCNGVSDGSITVTAGGGSGAGYTYSSDNGATFQASNVFTSLPAGTYQIVVKDGSGCSSAATPVTIIQPPAINVATSKTDVSGCFGNTNGSITVTASGGSGSGYTYSNDNGSTFQASNSFTSLAAGTYQIVVKDGNGCLSPAAAVVIAQPAAVTFTVAQVNVTCNGGSDGSITITASGGSGAGYVFSNDNGSSFQAGNSFTGLTAGTYSIVVKDGSNCLSAASPVTITEPLAVTMVITPTNISCNGANDGSIVVAASGGNGSYTYSKDNGTTFQAANSFTNLSAGNYQVVTKDGNGCLSAMTPITIIQPASVTFTTTSTDVSCNGGTDGTITVSASGGTGAYSYSVDNGTTFQASNAFTSLVAGTYQVVVKDANNCLSTASSVTLNQPTAITFTTSHTDVTSCTPGNDGSITVTSQTGGSGAGYTYSIDNGTTFQASNIFNGLIAGNYSVIVKDGNNCVSSVSSVLVNSPGGLSMSTTQQNVLCNGGNTGSITILASGGSGTYTYSKDNGATFTGSGSPFTFNSLTAGSYQLVVKDGNGCQFTTTVAITEPTVLTFTSSKTDVTCNGGTDGSITVTPSGGTSPYQYSRDGGATFQASNTFTGLAIGSYSIVVKDANNCITTPSSVTISQPTVLSFTSSQTNATSCSSNDGTISVTASGGTAPYQYSDDNGATFQASNSFTSLAPGSYKIVVKDVNNCTTSASTVLITAPSSLTFTTTKTDVTCNGGTNGSITVTVSGGTAPYQYSSDNGTTFQAGNVLSGLAAGTYQVVVKDVNSCQFASSVTVGQPSAITVSATKVDASCSGVSNGSITVTASGGNNVYTYSDDNGATFQPGNSFTSLAAGTYQVVVKDGNGCLSSATSVTIASGTMTPVFTKTDATCAANDGSIVVNSVSSGTAPFQYSIDNGTTFQASNTFSGLTVGTYNLVVKDNTGCLSSAIAVNVVKPITCGGTNCGAFTISVTDSRPTCSGQDDGKITISVTGGTPNYVVTLFDATQSFSQALAGPGPFQFINLSPSLNYQYTVKDVAGNTCTLPYSLPIQTNVQATASGFVDAKCFNQAVGQATITVTSGGTSPYEYSLDAGTTWISFTSPFTITNLMPAPSPYSILVRDGASDLCPAQVSVSISNAVADISISATSTDASCSNNDGQFQVSSVSGGTSPYTYQIDGVATTNLSITGLSGGSHTFTVTDANSCTKNFPFTINFPGLVNFTTGVFNPTCAGSGSDGAVLVTITSSGTFQAGITTDPSNPPATFQNVVSSGSSTVTFTGLSKNTYYVYVQATGALCPTKSTVTVTAGPDAVDFSFINKSIKCFEDKGGVRVFAFKGSGTVSYSYEVLNSGSIIQSGTITQLQALDTVDIVGFGNGDYQIRLFQDQSATTGCAGIISSAYKSFTLSGPVAPLDTLYVNRTISFPDLATGTMLVGISESQEEPYEVRIELTTPLLPGQAKLIDWTLATRNTQNLKVEYSVSNLFAGGYKLSIRDGLGCVKNYDINLDVDTNIFIPNIFTPNGDGSNETFYIRNLPANSSLSITNRWGNEVYSSSNYNGLWNGGAESDGVYYYRLVVAGGKIYNGWVEIMRGSTK